MSDDQEAGVPLHWSFSDQLPKPEDYVLHRSALTLEEIYAADEWETMGPTLPPPVPQAWKERTEGGSFQSVLNTAPNVPLAMESRADFMSGGHVVASLDKKPNRRERRATAAKSKQKRLH